MADDQLDLNDSASIRQLTEAVRNLENQVEGLKTDIDQNTQDVDDALQWEDQFNPKDHLGVGAGTIFEDSQGPVELASHPKPFHFQVIRDPDTPTTSVRVRGGRHTRTSDSTQKTVALSVDSGSAGSWDSYKEVTGFNAASTTYYVTLTLDNSVTPTTLTAGKATTTYPAGDTDATVKVIAKVTTNADSEIDFIEQYYDGGDVDDWGHADTSSVSDTSNGGTIVMQEQTYDTYGHVLTNSNYDITDDFYTESEVDAIVDALTFLGLTDTPGSYSGQGGLILRVNAGGTAVEFVDGFGLFWKLNNTLATEAYGVMIGDSTQTETINLDNNTLENGPWSVSDTTEAVSKDTGCMVFEGGIGVEKTVYAGTSFELNATNFWSVANCKVDVSAELNLACDTITYLTCVNGPVTLTAGTFINLNPTGELQISGVPGLSVAGHTKGLLTSEGDAEEAAALAGEAYGSS